MPKLMELSYEKHGELKLDPSAFIQFASSQHLLNIRVNEVASTLCDFPVFFNKNLQSGYWNLSAVTSFEMGSNLFVENNQWQAVYRPSSILSYPFYLMNSGEDEKKYLLGVDESNSVLSQTKGESLFDSNGQPTEILKRIKNNLKADIRNDIQTMQFGQVLQDLELLKPINLIIRYQDQNQHTLTGLNSINEDQLHSLSDAQLGELNRRGYLTPIHGILLSISQLNGLIQKNNKRNTNAQIQSIKLEVNKS
ncbi:SapC family protein [Aliiglaciecola sp. 3_MG-2023]|uniref:SapC family protein n=1 Tax=Aliiglaciecola sp. 3_MG-2023 TaxID=3062644 RepID=UPI0026E1B051|nr:SapC family protein [Aliiglaciecola sp. 3_MG-2023]MDO6692811.1 SapC family protein [Aliiglaciecola sp. 3_MG-2023]